jgi:hypothetical protein
MGDNIYMYLKETGCKNINLILLAQNRVHRKAHVSVVMNLQVP